MGRIKPRHVDDPVAFGARLRAARQERGLSLRDLAFEGCSASFISRVEVGQRVPSPAVVMDIARRLDMAPEELLGQQLDGRVAEAELVSAEVAARMGDESAEPRLQVLLDEAERLQDESAQSRLLEALGLIALSRRDDSQAVALLEDARSAGKGNGPRERPALHRALGRAYAGLGDIARSISVLQEAFDDAARDPVDPPLLAQFGTYLANAYTDGGRFAEAEKVLATVIRYEPELAPGNALRLDWALARTYAEEGKLDIAETYTRRVLARLDAAEEQGLVGKAHLLLAGVLLDQRRVDEATPHLEQCEQLLTREVPVDLGRFSIEKARLALAQGDLDAAAGSAREALDRTGATEPGNAGSAYAILAEVAYEHGDLDDARFLCRQAIANVTGSIPPHYAAEAYQLLSRIEESAGNLQAALDALRAEPGVNRAPQPEA